MLVDGRGEKCYVACGETATQNEQGASLPGVNVPATLVAEVAREVAQGYISGLAGGYRWYRQAG
jgi:hypothetical protein